MQNFIVFVCFLFLYSSPSMAQNTLKITNGSTIKVKNGASIVIKDGKFVNNGTFEAGDGTVKIKGTSSDANSTIEGSSTTTFNNLTIDKSSNNVQLQQSIEVKGTLDLQSGHLDLQNHQAIIQNTGTTSNASANSYVKTSGTGTLQQEVGNGAVLFPVGNTAYNPATLNNTGGTTDDYQIRVADNRLQDGTTGTAINDSSVRQTWMVTETNTGGTNLEMKLQWNRNEESATFNRNQAYITHYESGTWDTHPPMAAAGLTPYTLTRTAIQSLSPFSVASMPMNPDVPTMGEWSLLNLALLL
ncbi:MAG: hypothetical protein AB8B69_07355, partial [Chitinophagales bacterium]